MRAKNMKTYTLDEKTIARIDALTEHYETTASALIRRAIVEMYLQTFALQDQINIEAKNPTPTGV